MPIADLYIVCGVSSWGKRIWPFQVLNFVSFTHPQFHQEYGETFFLVSALDTSTDPPCGKALHADQADAARLSPEQKKDLQRRLAEWTEAHNQTEQKAEMKQQGIPLAFNMKVSLMWRMTLSITVGQHFHLTRPQNHLHGHSAPFARKDLK